MFSHLQDFFPSCLESHFTCNDSGILLAFFQKNSCAWTIAMDQNDLNVFTG
jgi:hypothetical protein